MNARQKAQQIVDHARESHGMSMQLETHLINLITEALQEAAKVEWPSEDEVESYIKANRADIETIISKACDAGFRSCFSWLKSRMSKEG